MLCMLDVMLYDHSVCKGILRRYIHTTLAIFLVTFICMACGSNMALN